MESTLFDSQHLLAYTSCLVCFQGLGLANAPLLPLATVKGKLHPIEYETKTKLKQQFQTTGAQCGNQIEALMTEV